MNILSLLATVWLFTTPVLKGVGDHDVIGFLGASVCQPPDGVTTCLTGTDDTIGDSYPAFGLQFAQPIDGNSTEAIAVITDVYCELFVVKHQTKARMRGIAVFFDPSCTTPMSNRVRWFARKLDR